MIAVALLAFAAAGLLFGLSGMLCAKHAASDLRRHLDQHHLDETHRLHDQHRYSPNGTRR